METPDFNELFNLDEINEVLDNQDLDPYRKEIGDRVVIVDYSSCTHLSGQLLDTDEDEEMQFNTMTYFIVIETGIKHLYDAYYTKYRQDLVIVNPFSHKKFRIISGHVMLK